MNQEVPPSGEKGSNGEYMKESKSVRRIKEILGRKMAGFLSENKSDRDQNIGLEGDKKELAGPLSANPKKKKRLDDPEEAPIVETV